ncbi:MAG: ferrous iron transport protein B [Firmicutes bacterium HGW-Firmicutes-1]|jgi:ferrous iron transport protein B|nr:MAG: ferrous iron transport protein B [Firmicutes bacterium HGW-Firmicutes-1]
MGMTYSSMQKNGIKDLAKISNRAKYTIALAGNPNTGKSSVFNALTGLHQHTGNWPGKTVVNAMGEFSHCGKDYILVDLPGTYSLFASSVEEEVARDFICNEAPDAIIVVTDATCLERNFNLLFQIMNISENVILCINLIDEAKKKKILIDSVGIEQELGIPVVLTSAPNGIGIQEIKNILNDVISHNYHNNQKSSLFIKPFDVNEILNPENGRDYITEAHYKMAEAIKQKYVIENGKTHYRDEKIDNFITSKKFGVPIMLLLLATIIWITVIGANIPSRALGTLLFGVENLLSTWFLRINAPSWIHGVLILGLYRTLAWVVAVMLPPMAIFFPLFTLLEDLGYLPRVAFNMDHLFKKACAHGKQCLTMCMGFGCNAAGVVGCRIIESPRERMIAILTNSFVPCNGRFPTLITISSVFFVFSTSSMLKTLIPAFSITLLIVIGISITLLVSYILSKTLLIGIPSTFTLELPPYRRPQFGRVLYTSIIDRTFFVLIRAICIAAPAGAIIWILSNTFIGDNSILTYAANFLNPLATSIGLDGFILLAFILGLPANEIVLPILLMSYLSTGNLTEFESLASLKEILLSHGWTYLTAINTMLFSLLHWPCSTTLWTIKKETGSLKWTLVSVLIPTGIAFFICFITTNIYKLL